MSPTPPLSEAFDASATAAAIAHIPEPDRVKLALLLVRDIEDARCIAPLSRLAEEATDASVRILRRRLALQALAIDARVLEWHRQQVPGAPYTYRLFIDTAPAAPVASRAALEAVLATVDRVKSLRSHLDTVAVSTGARAGPCVAAAPGLGHTITLGYGGPLT